MNENHFPLHRVTATEDDKIEIVYRPDKYEKESVWKMSTGQAKVLANMLEKVADGQANVLDHNGILMVARRNSNKLGIVYTPLGRHEGRGLNLSDRNSLQLVQKLTSCIEETDWLGTL
jgi:hypothetical protein